MLWGYIYMNVSKGDEVSKLHMEFSLKYAGWYLLNTLNPNPNPELALEYKYEKAPPLI